MYIYLCICIPIFVSILEKKIPRNLESRQNLQQKRIITYSQKMKWKEGEWMWCMLKLHASHAVPHGSTFYIWSSHKMWMGYGGGGGLLWEVTSSFRSCKNHTVSIFLKYHEFRRLKSKIMLNCRNMYYMHTLPNYHLTRKYLESFLVQVLSAFQISVCFFTKS